MEQMHGIFKEEMPNAEEEETSSDIQATIRSSCDFYDFCNNACIYTVDPVISY